jgi:D-erythro-7,8-dihydroneopterin triphosphate epimerase
MATIRIVDLKCRAIIGTHPWERKNRQDVVINLNLDYDASKASQSDQLKDALDYEKICQQIIKMVERSQCQLLEKLAGRILKLVLTDKRVMIAKVRIEKPHAIAQARHISFEMQDQN